jgi:hypothetical protein
VLNIGIAFGHNCGYAINPARDFAPRLFTLMAGFGTDTFRSLFLEREIQRNPENPVSKLPVARFVGLII